MLTTPQSYRAEAFLAAAKKLEIDSVLGVDLPEALAEQWGVRLSLDFSQPDTAVAHIRDFARERPLAAVIPVDDAGAVLAAQASQALGLPHNNVAAAEAARDKFQMRQMLAAAGVNSPRFKRFALNAPLPEVTNQVRTEIGYPCVVKPLHLNGSRGVMRANDAIELAAVIARLRAMLPRDGYFLVESYLPGEEVAIEAVLENGRLHPLAIFDKPETLALCEWTILVTNLPPESFSLADILCLQRLRWQIELLFKLWKNELSLDEWRSHQPHQILSELYAKLILALVQHWLLLLGCWPVESRSLIKATMVLRKHAFHILSALSDCSFLIRTLHLILPSLARCTVQKRKTRPATFQLLSRAIP